MRAGRMGHRLIRTSLAACGCALLCLSLGGCSTPTDIEDLMQAPRLSEDQSAVYDALALALGTEDYTLKYPRSGDYRSAFVFYDIDQDNVEEAFVFYQLDIPNSGTRMNILDFQSGGWRSVCEISGEDNSEVDFVQFESIESTEYKNVIVGWELVNSSVKQMSIYRFESGALSSALESTRQEEYTQSVIRDVDGDGLMDVVLLSKRRTSSTNRLSLISSVQGRIRQTDSMSFGDNVNGVSRLLFGRLRDGRPALYVDVSLSNAQFATEILVMEEGRLLPLINVAEMDLDSVARLGSQLGEMEQPPEKGQSPQEPSLEGADPYQREKNFLATLRAEEIPSADIDGDGVIEVPSSSPMLGYETLDEESAGATDEEIKYLTTYSAYENGVMTAKTQGFVNLQFRFMMQFPERWLGKVTVYSENSPSQWRFVQYTGDLSDQSLELLRLRRVSRNDFQDRQDTAPILLTTDPNGAYQMYGYLPPSQGEELALSENELNQLFLSL